MHQAGDALGRVGVAVELDALDEAARAVADAGDRDADGLERGGARLAGLRGDALRGDWLMPLLLPCRSSERRFALLRDQLVDPLEIVLGGLGPVLEERPGVAIDAARRGLAARSDEPLGELRPAALEEREPVGRVEVAAERELHGERPLVVGGLVGEELGEQLLARSAVIAVGLAGPAARRGAGGARGPRRGRPSAIRWARTAGRSGVVAGSSASSIAPERSRRRSAG